MVIFDSRLLFIPTWLPRTVNVILFIVTVIKGPCTMIYCTAHLQLCCKGVHLHYWALNQTKPNLIRLIPDQSLCLFVSLHISIVVSISPYVRFSSSFLPCYVSISCISLPFSQMKSHWNRRRNHCSHFPRFSFLNVVRQVEQLPILPFFEYFHFNVPVV